MAPKHPVHDLWAVLIARIYEVLALLCPIRGGHMRIIAFITRHAVGFPVRSRELDGVEASWR